MRDVPVTERCRVLARVLKLVGIAAADHEVLSFAARHGDLRSMFLAAQQSMLVHGRLYWEPSSDSIWQLSSEIIAEPDYSAEIEWDLKPLTAPGRLTLLCARPKLGKSTFTAHYVARKVLGGEFLGQPLEAAPVLWVSGPEESKYDIVRRFQELGVGNEQIWIYTGLSDIHAIAAKAAEIGAQLVVLDTLGRITGIRGESDNQAWVLWSNEALPVIRESNAAWLGVHHARKAGGKDGEAIRGASALFGLVDIAVSLHQGPGCNQRILAIDGTRFEKPEDLPLELVDGEYRVADFDTFGRGDSDAAVFRTRQVVRVLDDQPATCPEIAARLSAHEIEIPQVSLYGYLNELTSEGLAVCAGRGVKGDPQRWSLAPSDSFDSYDTLGDEKKRNESDADQDAGAEEPSGD
jgi:hypothetical protein